jgi:hypothetical protein
MSKLAAFIHATEVTATSRARKDLKAARAEVQRLARDPQMDGADREVARQAFKNLDRAISALED